MIHFTRLSFILFLLPAIGLLQCSDPGHPQDLRIVQKRIFDLYTGNGILSGGPEKIKAIRKLELSARDILEKGDYLAEPDITSPGVENKVSAQLGMIQTLAKAYQTQGQSYYHSGAVKQEIVKGLKHAEKWIKPGTPRPGNWYYWKIDAPRNLGPALILLHDELDAGLLKSQLECMLDLMTRGPYNKQGYILTGANGSMMGMNFIFYAVLSGEAKWMDLGREMIQMEMSVTNTKSGILEDYSYQFHDQLLYTGGYGEEFTLNSALALYLTRGTAYEIPKAETELFSRFIAEHSRWVVIGDRYDISVKGRGIRSSPVVKPTPFLLMSCYPSACQEEIKKFTASLVFHRKDPWSLTDAPFADLFQSPADQELYGFRYFYKNDYAVSRKPGFYLSVKMFSDQNRDYEILTGSNPGGHHRSNGFTYFSRSGNEIWEKTKNLDAAYDWEHVPGTTSRLDRRPPNFGNFSKSTFAGGAGSDDNGIAAFVLIPAVDDFSAHKSYFTFDKGFVTLGSAITSKEAGPPVSTTLTQWGTKDDNATLILSTGEQIRSTAEKDAAALWAYCDSVGYLFNACKGMKIRKDSLYTTLFLNHGPHPQQETYAYTVLPACSKEELTAYGKNPQVQILRNSTRVHAFRDLKNRATGIVFWEAGSFDRFTVDHPAVLYCREKNGGMELTISNPFYNRDTIRLTLKNKFKHLDLPPEARVLASGDQTIFTLRTASRRMYRIGLDAGQVHQPAREDNLPYEDFKILRTEHTPARTFLTVRIPEIAQKDGRLFIHYWQSFLQKELLPSDRTDTVAPGVYTYQWDNPGVELKKHYNSDYNYNLRLRSGLHNVWEQFTVARNE